MKWAAVSGRGRPIAIGDQSELYYFGPVSVLMCLVLLLVSRGNAAAARRVASG